MFLIPECSKCLTNARRAWVRYFGHEWVKNMSDNMKIREFYYFVHKFFLVVNMQLFSILVDIMKYTRYFPAKIGPKIDQNRSKIGQNRSKSVKNRFWPIFHDPETEPSFLSTHMPTFEKTGFSRRTGIRIGKITAFLNFDPLYYIKT